MDEKAEEVIRLALEEERTRLMGFRTIYRNIAPLIRTLFADPPAAAVRETGSRVKQEEVSCRSGMDQGGVSQSWAMSQTLHSQTGHQDSRGKRRSGRPRGSGKGPRVKEEQIRGNDKGPQTFKREALLVDKL